MGRYALTVGLLALTALLLPPGSSAATTCKTIAYKVHSKPHWIWVAKTRKVDGHTVIVRRHGKIVYVHVRVSYVVKHKKVCATTPSTPTPPQSTIAPRLAGLHVHINPTLTRNPANPYEVTLSSQTEATWEPSDASHAHRCGAPSRP